MNEKIRVQIGDSHNNHSRFSSSLSKVSSSKIQYGESGVAFKPKNYAQRQGEFSIEEEDDVPDLLNADYPSLVEVQPVLDADIDSFQACDQIYGAWNLQQENEMLRIKRKFGHSQALQTRSPDIKRAMLKNFTDTTRSVESQSKTAVKPRKTSKMTIKIVKKISPQHYPNPSDVLSRDENNLPSEAPNKRVNMTSKNIPEVDCQDVKRFVRESFLNEKFKGTWVADGLTDAITIPMLAKTIKQPPFVHEIIRADHNADDWLEKMNKTENFSWVFKDPPINLGHYYNQFCGRNNKAYNDYKSLGIKKLANQEVNRSQLKESIQGEARVKGIKKANMLRYKKQRDKETIFRKIIPQTLLAELMKQDKTMASQMQFSQTEGSANTDSKFTESSNQHQEIQISIRPFSQDHMIKDTQQPKQLQQNFDLPTPSDGQYINVVNGACFSAEQKIRQGHEQLEGADQRPGPFVNAAASVQIMGEPVGMTIEQSEQDSKAQTHSKEKTDRPPVTAMNFTLPESLAKKQSPFAGYGQPQRSQRLSVELPARKRLGTDQQKTHSLRLSFNDGRRAFKNFENISSSAMPPQTAISGMNKKPKDDLQQFQLKIYDKMKRVEPSMGTRESVQMIQPGKRTNQNDVAKLTERLAVPKNYSRMNYLDINLQRLRSQSIDWAVGSVGSIVVDQGGAHSVLDTTNLPLPHLGKQMQQKLHEYEENEQQDNNTAATTETPQSNFEKLMSLDFGNSNTRRRQFMNRTCIVDDSATKTSPLGAYQQTSRKMNNQTAQMALSINSKLSKNELDQIIMGGRDIRPNNHTTRSRGTAGILSKQFFSHKPMINGLNKNKQNVGTSSSFAPYASSRQAFKNPHYQVKQTSKIGQMKNRQKFLKGLHDGLQASPLKSPCKSPNRSPSPSSRLPMTGRYAETQRSSPRQVEQQQPQQSPRGFTFAANQAVSVMTSPLQKTLLNSSSSSFCTMDMQHNPHQSQSPKRKTSFLKARLSNFELDMGQHKQRASQLRLYQEAKIVDMMSKVKNSPPRARHSPIMSKAMTLTEEQQNSQSQINGTNLQQYDWQRERKGQATFESIMQKLDDGQASSGALNKLAMLQTMTANQGSANGASKSNDQQQPNRLYVSKEQQENLAIIQKCMKYVRETQKVDAIRDHEINMGIEDYLSDRRAYLFDILDDLQTYPPSLQKTILNYKLNYDDEQEMFSREIIQLYKTGATDPRFLLMQLMKKDADYESDSGDDAEEKAHKKELKKRFAPPNLTCFKKKDKEQDYAN